ncbi:hypothetical protein [Listeria booriae]|uniref:hypothetical protein n=1 Tax=Listeria booriae TaxID=1552123 RepID=UPI0016268D46|nr:hypothetical protein [Listeria booriae]MBC1983715.1 hypothetical protein [Listeria booriae]MBC2674628.1 hypothetical protein [Listeria booriae]
MGKIAVILLLLICKDIVRWICINISIPKSEAGFIEPTSATLKLVIVASIFLLVLQILLKVS